VLLLLFSLDPLTPRKNSPPSPSLNHPVSLSPSTLALLAGPPLLSGNYPGAALGALLPAFLAIQATRVKFVFEPDALEVLIAADGAKTDNAFVGGRNRWAYASFKNWEIFPSPAFPVLVYFKETQTKPEGQIHFFPVIFDFKTLYAVMKARCGRSENSA
jgi:hypothetical protein